MNKIAGDTQKVVKLGPLWFQPGIKPFNVTTMLFAAFGTLAVITFMGFVQPYLLSEVLQIPQSEQGKLTGGLAAFQEIIVILLAGLVGATSDKLGRRRVYVAGFFVLAIGYGLYPLADSVNQLYLYRAIFAIGISICAIMLSACIVDYIQERSRGRWVATASVFNGLGVLLMAGVLSRMPQWFQNAGEDAVTSARYSFWIVAAGCIVIGLILLLGLYRGDLAAKKTEANVFQQFVRGLSAARNNPRLAVAYGAAFIGRGDFAVVGTYFSLWLMQAGIDKGMTAAAALGKAGMLFGLIQLSALLWAGVMGVISDRLNRVTAVSIGLTIAGSGYLFMSQITDPFGSVIYAAAILLGMGETAVVVSAGALLGQEATPKIRGAIVGVFGLCGGLGILVTTWVGGILFDDVGRTAPFAMMGLLNFVLMAIAIRVRLSAGATEQPQE